jgi:hypothetical protein
MTDKKFQKESLLEEKIRRKEYTKRFEEKQDRMQLLLKKEAEHKRALIEDGAFKDGFCLEGCQVCKTKYCYALQGKMGMLPSEKPCNDCTQIMELAHFLNTKQIHLFDKSK